MIIQVNNRVAPAFITRIRDYNVREDNPHFEWAGLINFAEDNPQRHPLKQMQDTLKLRDQFLQRSGRVVMGRKPNGHLKLIQLLWHADEKGQISQKDMRQAAEGALCYLGAQRHQAIIAAYKKTRNPHMAILLNKISPVDGRCLPSKGEAQKLAQWASRYDMERQQHRDYQKDDGLIFPEKRPYTGHQSDKNLSDHYHKMADNLRRNGFRSRSNGLER